MKPARLSVFLTGLLSASFLHHRSGDGQDGRPDGRDQVALHRLQTDVKSRGHFNRILPTLEHEFPL